MAERRFYFWESYGKALDMLTDAEAGRFVKACCAFAFGGVEPDFSDEPRMAFAWQIVSAQITTSVEIGVKNAERGRRGGRKSGESRRKKAAKKDERSTASSTASSDMNMYMNVSADASLEGSASAHDQDGGDSDEY